MKTTSIDQVAEILSAKSARGLQSVIIGIGEHALLTYGAGLDKRVRFHKAIVKRPEVHRMYCNVAAETAKLVFVALGVGEDVPAPDVAVASLLRRVAKESGDVAALRNHIFQCWAEPIYGLAIKFFPPGFGSGPDDTLDAFMERVRAMQMHYNVKFNADHQTTTREI